MQTKTQDLQYFSLISSITDYNTTMSLTQVFYGVVSLLAVHPDCLGIGTSHSVANDVTSDKDAGAKRRSPGHDDAVGQWSDVQRAGLVGYLTLCKNTNGETLQQRRSEQIPAGSSTTLKTHSTQKYVYMSYIV